MKKIGIVAMIAIILLSGCGGNQALISDTANVEKVTASTGSEPEPAMFLSETPDKQASIYGRAEGGMIDSLTVHIKGEPKTYDWNNVSNPSFYPQLYCVNLDAEGEDEVVIVLTTGTGTGVRDSQIHVLTTDFTEIPVADPRAAVMNRVKVNLKSENGIRRYTVTLEGKVFLFEFKESDSLEWFDKPAVINILKYAVLDHVLVAEMPLQISMGNFLGYVLVSYELVNGKLEPARLELHEGSSL